MKSKNPLYYLLFKGLTESSCPGMQIGHYFDYPSLIFPIQDIHGTLKNNQYIYFDGEFQKKFEKGGKVTGCFFKFDDLDKAKVIFVAEGVATAAALRETILFKANIELSNRESLSVGKAFLKSIKKQPTTFNVQDEKAKTATVVAALTASNISKVCRLMKEKYTSAQVIAAPDGDKAGNNTARDCELLGIPSIFPPRGLDWSDVYSKGEREALEEVEASKTIVRILKLIGRRGYLDQRIDRFT